VARILISFKVRLPEGRGFPPSQIDRRLNMKTNEGTLDRGLRIAAGLVLIALAATGVIGQWGYIGVVPVLTGAIGFCPLYSMLGINTCPVRR